MHFLETLRDLAFVLAVVLVGIGIYGIILWVSTRKTMWREARVEVTTSILDDLDYAVWRTALFFSTMDKSALVRRSIYLLVVTACLAVITDGLNRGTITWWGIAWTIIAGIVAALVILFICFYKYHMSLPPRRC